GSFRAAAKSSCARAPSPVTTISAVHRRRSSALSSARCANRFSLALARTPSNSRSACSRQACWPVSTASRMSFCAASALVVGVGVGGARRHHEALGVVRGEEVAAIGRIGVVALERRLPVECALEIAVLAGCLVERQRGADHGGMIGGEAREQELAVAPGMAES